MFKKFVYFLSMILGIFFVFKMFSKEKSFPKLQYIPEKEPEKKVLKRTIPNTNIEGKLNERQREILKLIKKREVLLPSDIYALHPNVSTRTLRRDMTSLVETNLVRQEGSTRDTKYILNI